MMTALQHQEMTDKAAKASHESHANQAYPSRTIVHTKLEMTEPGDHDELEAEEMANTIVSGGKISRKISGGASGSSGIAVSQQMEHQLAHLQGGGRQMPEGLRNMMESGFGRDFSQVRLHTDNEAAEMSSSIHAKAFTHGNDIYFNRGQFAPETAEGQHLVAHELTHTVQQAGKVAREEEMDAMPKHARNIRVMDQEKDEEPLKKSLLQVLNGYSARSETIPPSKSKVDTESLINNVILPDCMALIEIAKEATGDTKQQLVQQLYNTLSQVSVALDILPKPNITNLNTSWMQCRKSFVSAVQELASLAKNPAIAVLMYEGTYYPDEFSTYTESATDHLFNNDGPNMADLYYYGAVCNNAAYGSVRASGASFFNNAIPIKKLTMNKERTTRDNWENYNPKGTGFGDGSNGENALDGAKQGDIVVFWKLDKIPRLNDDKKKKLLKDNSMEVTTHGTTKTKQGDGYTAHHIEVIVGVMGTGEDTRVLLSGAHYQAVVNGFERDNNGDLAWKTAKEVRGKDGIRIIRRIPMDNEQELIPVDIPSIMANQKYKRKNSGINYTVDDNEVPIYIPQNTSDSVTITWLTKNGANQDVEPSASLGGTED